MSRKLVSLFFAVIMLTALALPLSLAEDDTPDLRAGYYYVKTENGKGLNVRDNPGGGNVIGSLKYGTRIYTTGFTTPEWALITYKYDKPGLGMGERICRMGIHPISDPEQSRNVPGFLGLFRQHANVCSHC